MSASSVAVVVGWYLTSGEELPTARGSEMTMAQGGGRWGVWGSWRKMGVVGFLDSHVAHTAQGQPIPNSPQASLPVNQYKKPGY